MDIKTFAKSGHPKTLFSAFLYFDFSFMVWVMLGALGNAIAETFSLGASQKGLMVGVPVLTGSLLRLVLGPLADRIGGRNTALLGLTLTFVPLLLGGFAATSFQMVLIIGLLLGVAGASFAVALPMASRWYPPEQQGLVMGLAGAGNSGTVLASLFAPRIAATLGDWRPVFLIACAPIALAWLVIFFLAKDAPNKTKPKTLSQYFGMFKQADTWYFCILYTVTFGGFVGLGSFLPIFFKDTYKLDGVTAGTLAAFCVFAGSFARPIGGYLADKLGGIRMLLVLYAAIAVLAIVISSLPPLWLVTALLFLLMTTLGTGNGAVFQVVPQRFAKEVPLITGIVGAAGGIGGFALPYLLGNLKQSMGSYGPALIVYTIAAVACLLLIVAVQKGWRARWMGAGGKVGATDSPQPRNSQAKLVVLVEDCRSV